MRHNLVTATLSVTILLTGCEDPKLDTSSDNDLEQSMQEVKESLPEDKRDDFDSAAQLLLFSQIDTEKLLSGESGAEQATDNFRKRVDGLSGAEVIATAEKVRAEREKRQKKQALEEIQELEDRKEQQEAERQKLEQFEVERSRFYKDDSGYRERPVIEVTVLNNTDKAVSRAYFDGTLASPDRSVPWLEESFKTAISGGIDPGEEHSMQLGPNPFSEWGQVDAPSDAIFTVTVERLDGPDGEPIADLEVFTEQDQERLDELKAEYGQSKDAK